MYNEIKHTPSPWMAESGPEGDAVRWVVCQHAVTPYLIATIENGAPGDFLDTEEANARLIAAAPELLAACKEALNHIDRLEGDSTVALCDRIQSAIAKATGGDAQ